MVESGAVALECGGERSATPLWIRREISQSKAPPPLRSAGALQTLANSLYFAYKPSLGGIN
jgi:hypothetical protein